MSIRIGLVGCPKENTIRITDVLADQEFQWIIADSVDEIEALAEAVDIVLVWENSKDPARLPLVERIRAGRNPVSIIVVLPRMIPEQIIAATRLGVIDSLIQPLDYGRLAEAARRAVQVYDAHGGGKVPCDQVLGVLGESPRMIDIFKQVGVAASNELSVLLTGETGVGKEVASFCIHKHSARFEGPFVAINCAALSENLVEAELFGHVRGAFTGSVRDVPGKVEIADGGTLLLDEVGDLSERCQAKLLRFLENRTFYRLGESVARVADVRIVAATNRDLVSAVASGSFREDLYYRLAQITISIPPLRERIEDIRLLIQAFIAKANATLGLLITGVAPKALEAACRYTWPGNVRELKNVVFQAAIDQRAGEISVLPIPAATPDKSGKSGKSVADLEAVVRAAVSAGTVGSLLGNFEAVTLKTLLDLYGGNRSRISSELGISRNTLRAKLREHGIDDEPPSAQVRATG